MSVKKSISVLTIFIAACFACKSPPLPRTFLIPSDYQGPLRIVYGEKCGVRPREENGREVFYFQRNGLVILTSGYDSKVENDFYLVDGKGRRTKVNQIAHFEQRVNRMPAILAGGETVSSSVINIVNAKNTLVAGGADCIDFYLYNKDTTRIEDSNLSKRLDVLTNSVVNACRGKE